jgi:hypothetical protein
MVGIRPALMNLSHVTDCCSHGIAGDIFASTDAERVPPHFSFSCLSFYARYFSFLNLSKQVFCIFLFLGAASLFGTIVSQINEIVASQTTISKELDCILEAYFSIEPK